MNPTDVTDTINKMLPIIDRWKQQYGEAVATESIRAYLTGVNDAISTLMALGTGGLHGLYDRLKGN